MSDLWSEIWKPGWVDKLCEQHGQEIVEHAIKEELQFCLDDVTPEKINKAIKRIKESKNEQ